MKISVYINSLASVSALGKTPEKVWKNYKDPRHFFRKHDFDGNQAYVGFLPQQVKEEIEAIRVNTPALKKVDDSVLYAVAAARVAVEKAEWKDNDDFGINIGSSRGATGLFEQYHKGFIEKGKAETLTSPMTTLGNISSWVGQDLQSSGPQFSHSVTCSTGMHSILNGIAWLTSGFSNKFLVGASEAALTPFTVSQMQAMKIYADQDSEYPCQALNMQKERNSMILGEAASMLCLEKENSGQALGKIVGIGYATEKLEHSVSISANGTSFQKSMKMAIGETDLAEVDAVVMHAPGTVKGDIAEVNAIKAVFNDNIPALTTNKWKLGHTFGASGLLSLEMALLMLQHHEFINVPYSELKRKPSKLENILVNAVGFGGNAVSILLSRS